MPLDQIVDSLARKAPGVAHFVIFDACRNLLQTRERGARGFVPVTERQGMFIAFSTSPGETASDGESGATSGPYAAALSAELMRPGQDHLDVFQNTKERVYRSTGGQVPCERNGLLKRIRFASQSGDGAKPPQSRTSELASTRQQPLPAAPRNAAFPYDGVSVLKACALATSRSAQHCWEQPATIEKGKLAAKKGVAGKPGYIDIEGSISSSGLASLSFKGVALRGERRGNTYSGTARGQASGGTISAVGVFDTGRGVTFRIARF